MRFDWLLRSTSWPLAVSCVIVFNCVSEAAKGDTPAPAAQPTVRVRSVLRATPAKSPQQPTLAEVSAGEPTPAILPTPRIQGEPTLATPRTATSLAAQPAESQGTPTPEVAAAPTAVKSAPIASSPDLDPDAESPVDLKPASFNGAEPGTTTHEQLVKLWGEPSTTHLQGNDKVLTFTIEPFKHVNVTFDRDVVSSIIIHLREPIIAGDVGKQLQLDALKPVSIPNSEGNVLGQVYPERGVMFGFQVAVAVGEHAFVSQILVEPISSEPFVLRAQYDRQHSLGANLADLKQALELTPNDPKALWLKAKFLGTAGRPTEALTSIQRAIEIDSADMQFQLTKASLLGATAQFAAAEKLVQEIIAAGDTKPHVKAEAQLLLGDLAARGPGREYHQATEHHLAAIAIAKELANSNEFEIRRAAKRVLIDAHLAIAQNVAAGDWQRKPEVTKKWLARAGLLVDDYQESERGGPEWKFLLARMTLQANAQLNGPYEPTETTEAAIELGRKIIAESKDLVYKQLVERQLGMALLDAARVEQARGNSDEALRYGQTAVTLLEGVFADRQKLPSEQAILGQLYFLMGTLQAVSQKDYREAVSWFDKSRPILALEGIEKILPDAGLRGEMLVGMGVSYWENGNRDDAVAITLAGSKLMQQAVKAKQLDLRAMAVPFGNLARMHQALGDTKKATDYAELAKKVEATSRTR